MKKRIFKLLSILFLLILLLLLYLFLTKNYNFYIPCVFKEITGFYCPGCGITRCLLAFLNLNFYQAFRYNPLVFLMLPFLLVYISYKIYLYVTEKEDKIIKKIPNYIWYILLFITILFGILRNIEMFSFLAPTIIK